MGIELYYVIVGCFIFATLINLQKQKKNNLIENYFFYFLFFVLFTLSAFKDISVGTDTIHYLYVYDWIGQNEFSGRYELLFFTMSS